MSMRTSSFETKMCCYSLGLRPSKDFVATTILDESRIGSRLMMITRPLSQAPRGRGRARAARRGKRLAAVEDGDRDGHPHGRTEAGVAAIGDDSH